MLKPVQGPAGRLAAVVALAIVAGACDVTVGAIDYQVREERRFTVSGQAKVILSTFDGSIEVRGWDRPEVLIEVEKHAPDQESADRIRIDSRQDGSLVTVTIPQPDSGRSGSMYRSPSARIVAAVPLQTELVIRSGDGSVSVRRVNGPHDIRTDDGSVRVSDARGALLVRTEDGSVVLDDVHGAVDAESGDGSIVVDGVVSGLRLETRDGSIRFTARDGSSVSSDWTVTTGDGSVRGRLPKTVNAEVDAESRDGRVTVEGLSASGRREASSDDREARRGRRSAKGTLGSGGRLVKLRTGDGSITVQVW